MKTFFNPQRADETSKGLNGHMEGKVADHIITNISDFLKAAGRDYYIKRIPAPHPSYVDSETGLALPIGGAFWLLRSDTDAVVSPKTVTEQYAPMTLMDIAAELQPWCDQGWATPDAVYGAKQLPDGGEALEALCLRLDAGDIDGPAAERLMHYLVILNPHGQGGKVKGKLITFRPACSNAFAAISRSFDIAIPHRIGKEQDPQEIMQERMANAVAGWQQAREHIAAMAERINQWQDTDVSQDLASDLTRALLKIGGDDDLDEIPTRTRNKYDSIMAGFANREAGTLGRSAWDWINAVTFYTSSPQAKSTQKSKVDPIDRMIRNIDPHGTGFDMENRSLKLVSSLV